MSIFSICLEKSAVITEIEVFQIENCIDAIWYTPVELKFEQLRDADGNVIKFPPAYDYLIGYFCKHFCPVRFFNEKLVTLLVVASTKQKYF